jgi:pyruvate, water dikinase
MTAPPSSRVTYAGIPEEISGQDTLLSPDAAAFFLADREAFDRLAAGSGVPGALQRSEVKFLITDIRTDSPKLYFINSNAFEYHWVFFCEALDWPMDLLSFNTRTYTDINRRLIAGSVIANDRYSLRDGVSGIYTIEFWPSDPIHAEDAELAVRLIRAGMAFAADRLLYHPIGETQVRIYQEERERFDAAGVSAIFTSDLFKGVDYAALNTGEACGILTDGSSTGTFSAGDIVVFQSIPNDIGHLAGIITTIPQTPLSHINLQAMQNGTPNVYIPGFLDSPEFEALLGRTVRLTALPEGYSLEEISFAEALEWLESVRPDSVTILPGGLEESRIRDLDDIRLVDSGSFGAKAAGLGELSRCLPSSATPHGCVLPFRYYHEFMVYNGLYAAADSLLASDEFNRSSEDRERMLGDLRSRILEGEFPPWMLDSLSSLTARFEPGTSLRCRSSTNNEDLPGFNGAGLYSSFTHHPDEGPISETIRKVWASIWTYRAFEEREYYRIDHLSAAMGVVIHPSYQGELANGVAVTQNIFNPFITGFYVNVQVGEDMVTNPESESVPEEFLITEQNLTGEVTREIQYIGFSNRVPEGGRVLSEPQIEQLDEYLGIIHRHFAAIYGADPEAPDFAMEIEFKVTAEGDLVVKQARPWVAGS